MKPAVPAIGVLLMAYGGPDSLEDLPGYLADIRKGRPTPALVLEEIAHHYRRVGGRSPLLEISKRQMLAVSELLNSPGAPARFQCYLGMRHWAPWIEETVRDMLYDGITQAVSLALTPHYSRMSIARYQEKIAEGLEMYRGRIEFRHVESYHTAPGFIQAISNRVAEGLSRWPRSERSDVHVVFTAHSLPARILEQGDPYDRQVHESGALAARCAGLPADAWSFAYQSAGRTREPWLGPSIIEHLEGLKERGVCNVVAVSVGFISEHVEVLYDLDVQARERAAQLGIRFERPPTLNDDPLFMQSLTGVIRDRARPWLEE